MKIDGPRCAADRHRPPGRATAVSPEAGRAEAREERPPPGTPARLIVAIGDSTLPAGRADPSTSSTSSSSGSRRPPGPNGLGRAAGRPLDAGDHVIASVIRPSRIIARASSNGHPADARGPRSRRGSPRRRSGRSRGRATASSSVTEFERWTRASSRHVAAPRCRSPRGARAGRPSSAVSPSGTPPSGISQE